MSTFNELIDFTRSTTGTYLDSVVYGDDKANAFAGSGGSTWTVVDKNTVSGTQPTSLEYFTGIASGLTIGAQYKLELTVTNYAGNNDLGMASAGGVGSLVRLSGNGTITSFFTATAVSLDVFMRSSNSGAISVSVKELTGGQVSGTPLLRTAAINEPRLEYDASGNPLGLLIEEVRSNVLQYSEGFTNTNWGKTNLTATANAATAPDGTQTADKLQLNSTTASVYMVQDNSTSSSGYKTATVYAKDNNAGYVILRVGDQPSSADRYLVLVDLSNGNVVDTAIANNPSNVSHTVTPVGNNWYRISVTANLNESSIRVAITPYCVSSITHTNGTPTNAGGAVGNSVYIWGAQLETGSFPTSYIPTSGSAVTRTKDLASLPVERFAYSQAQGSIVFYADVFSQGQDATPRLYEFSDGSNDNAIRLYNPPVVDRLTADVRSGGVSVFADNLDSPDFNEPFKIFQTYKVNDLSVGFNGKLEQNDTSGAVPIGIVKINLFSKHSGSNVNNGHIKQIQYYPKRLSNEELELLTQPSASPTMNLTFDGQATSTLVEGLHD